MPARMRIPCFSALIAILSVAILAAQNAPPRRDLDVPYVPSTPDAVSAMLKLAAVTKTDTVYDLGCGDGRIVITAAKTFGAHGVGIDIDPARISEARQNARKAGVENLVRFEQNDLFKADIHEASVVTLFLLSSVNVRLRPKLLQDLRPGTRIVSNTFTMGDWKPDKQATIGDEATAGYLSHKLFLWLVPTRHAN